MEKNGLIIILCKTNSETITNLVYEYMKEFYGNSNVKKMMVALYGDLDELSDKIIKKGIEKQRRMYIIKDAGFRPYDDMYYKPFCNMFIKKGCSFAHVFDPCCQEFLYSGTSLREKIIELIFETKKLTDNYF